MCMCGPKPPHRCAQSKQSCIASKDIHLRVGASNSPKPCKLCILRKPFTPPSHALLLHDTDERKPTCASVHTQAPVETGGRRAPG